MLNGPLVNNKLIASEGRLQRMISTGATNSQIINEFYRAAFCRAVTNTELQEWNDALRTTDKSERVERLEDFVWGLLNSRSFRSNH
jgi:hypothetical protein